MMIIPGLFILLFSYVENKDISQRGKYLSAVHNINHHVYQCSIEKAQVLTRSLIESEGFVPFYHDLRNFLLLSYEAEDSKSIKKIIDILIREKKINPERFVQEFPYLNERILIYYQQEYNYNK